MGKHGVPETAAAVSSVEVREEFEGQGESRKLVGYTKKIKWDKTAAIKHGHAPLRSVREG